MVRLAQLLNSLLFMLLFFGCQSNPKNNNIMLNAANHNFTTQNGVFLLNNQPYTGYVYTVYPKTKDTLEVIGYLNGKEHGVWRKYYEDGKLKQQRVFKNGLKEDKYIAYWQNGKKQLEYNFKAGEYNGNCAEWNQEGTLTKKMNYAMGYEDGAQQMFYDNGKVRSNYVIKDGRRFGLLGTKNCINVSDSVFKN